MIKRIAAITLCICMLLPFSVFAVITDQENNLALNKPSNVENMIDGYPASRVNDGDINSFWTGGSAVDYDGAAVLGLKSGWQVDLQAEYQISNIVVHLRNDVDQGTRHKFDVRLSNDPKFEQSEVVYVEDSADELPRGTVININVNTSETYRYVRIARTDAGYFALSEVMVYGQEGGAGDSGFVYENYEKALHLLSYLGVYERAAFDEKQLMSRGEALDKTLRLCKLTDVATGKKQTFQDVPSEHPYHQAVETAAAAGIISGDGSGRFLPNERVTAGQFAKMVLFALNHDYIASLDGYYSLEVMKAADRYRLFRGVTVGANEFLSAEQAAVVMYNALQMPVIYGIFNGESFSYESIDTTVLESYHGLTEYRGVITANPYTTLEMPQERTADYIQINRKDYTDNTAMMHEYLGQSVDFFIKDTDPGAVELFTPTTRNQFETVSCRDLDKAKSSLASGLTTQEGQKYSLADGAYIIYNGVADLDYSFDNFFAPYVQLRLLDNNSDGEYEVVFVEEYTSVLVKNVIDNGDNISFIGEDGDTLTLGGNSRWGTVKTFGGVSVPAGNVESGDILCGLISRSGEVYSLTAGIREVSGIIDEVIQDGDYLNVSIDGKIYEVHHQYEELLRIGSSYATQLTPGMEANFAVDTQDRIIALAGKNSGTQWQYAFLLATNTKSGGVDMRPDFRVLCIDSVVRDYKPADKVDVDGREFDADDLAEEIKRGTIAAGMIKMKLRNDKISAIRTTNSGTGAVSEDTLNETPCTEGLYYLARLNCLYYLDYRMEAHTRADSPVFYVATHPDGSIAANEVESMKVRTINGSIRDWDATYFTAYYDKDPEDKTPGAYLRYVQVGSAIEPIDEKSAIALVDKVNQYVDPEDKDGETLYRLIGFNNTGAIQMPFEPNIYSTSNPGETPQNLKQGDMIVYEEDNGRIVAFDVLYRISRDKDAVETSTSEGPFYVYSDALINQMTGRQRLNYSILRSKTSDLISVVDRIPGNVSQEELDERTEVYNIPSNIFIYSEKQKKIQKGNANDLDKMLYSNNPNARIMVYTHEGYMQYVVAFDFE